MLIDIIFAILMVLAIWKGFQKGLIVGFLSLIGVIIATVAAMKLSTVVAAWIGRSVKVSEEWLPVISFIVVFIVVLLLIRLVAKAIEKTMEFALLGWVNRLGGIIFYAVIYLLVFSVLLFYAVQMQLIKPEVVDKSVTYSFVQPWGPRTINAIGTVVPWFRDMFGELEKFFDHVSSTIPPSRPD